MWRSIARRSRERGRRRKTARDKRASAPGKRIPKRSSRRRRDCTLTAIGWRTISRFFWDIGPVSRLPSKRDLGRSDRANTRCRPDGCCPSISTPLARSCCAVVTPEIVMQIRAATEKQHVLGRRFGITQSEVSRIKNKRSWRDID
jgi:hypothetical protein